MRKNGLNTRPFCRFKGSFEIVGTFRSKAVKSQPQSLGIGRGFRETLFCGRCTRSREETYLRNFGNRLLQKFEPLRVQIRGEQ